MRRRAVGLAAAFALASGALGCRDTSVVSTQLQPTALLDGFVSGQKVADVEASLRQAGRTLTVLEAGDNTSKSSARLPLSIRVIRVSPFDLWDLAGDLRLEFVDGELAATWFYPREPARFEAESRKRGLHVEQAQSRRLHTATELRSATDHTGARYWAWEDVNLRQKVDSWIKRNA